MAKLKICEGEIVSKWNKVKIKEKTSKQILDIPSIKIRTQGYWLRESDRKADRTFRTFEWKTKRSNGY